MRYILILILICCLDTTDQEFTYERTLKDTTHVKLDLIIELLNIEQCDTSYTQ